MYGVCAVCAPRLYTLSPMCNDGVCLAGRFALLSIPEGTVQCGALLYHCLTTHCVCWERERDGGLTRTRPWLTPNALSLLCVERCCWGTVIHHTYLHRNTHSCLGEMYISGSTLCKHRETLKLFVTYDKRKEKKRKENAHKPPVWGKTDKHAVIIRVFLCSKGGIFNKRVLGNTKWDLTATVPYMMFATPCTRMT